MNPKKAKVAIAYLISISALISCDESSRTSAPTAGASAPRLLSTSPENGTNSAELDLSVAAQFSDAIDPSSVNTASFAVFVGSNQLPGTVNVEQSTVRFTPASRLRPETQYHAVLDGSIRSLSGKALTDSHRWEFRTRDLVPPSIVETSPFPNQVFFPIVSSLRARFSEPVEIASINGSTFLLELVGDGPVASQVHYDATSQTATLVPLLPLLPSQTPREPGEEGVPTRRYRATLRSSIRDLVGNPMSSDFVWHFTTQDFIPPTVESTDPTQDVPFEAGNSVRATFVEPLLPETVHAGSFQIRDEEGNEIAANSISYGNRNVNFQYPNTAPFLGLFPNTTYNARLTTAIQDTQQNPMSAEYTWSFQTRSGWAGALPIDNQGLTFTWPRMGYDPVRGEYRLVWSRRRFEGDPQFGVYAMRLSRYPNSAEIVEVSQGSELGGNFGNFVVTPDGTTHYAFKRSLATGQLPSMAARRQFSDGTFESEIFMIDHDGASAGEPTDDSIAPQLVATPNGAVHAFFFQRTGSVARLVANRRPAGGNWLQAPADSVPFIDAGGANSPVSYSVAASPATAPDANAVYVAFAQNATPVVRVFVTRYSPATDSWSAPIVVCRTQSPAAEAGSPSIAIAADGRVFVAFQQRLAASPTLTSILVNERDPATGQWLPEANIPVIDFDASAGALEAQEPKVVVAPNGVVHAVFRQKLATTGPYSILENRRVNGVWLQGNNIPVAFTPAINQTVEGMQLYINGQNQLGIVFSHYPTGYHQVYGTTLAWQNGSYGNWSPAVRIDPIPVPEASPGTVNTQVQAINSAGASSDGVMGAIIQQRETRQIFLPPSSFMTVTTENLFVNQFR